MNRFIKSFLFAFIGLKTAWREQANFRIHIVMTVMVCAVGSILSLSFLEWSIVLICIGMVIAAELFNSAIEKWVDLVNPQWSESAGKIKDISAGAVLIVSITSAVVGLIIIGGKLFTFLANLKS